MNQSLHIDYLKVCFLNFINFTYFIMDDQTKQIAIIDPAWESNKIESFLQELNGTLTTILLTHSHFDHINLVNSLLDKYNPQVFMSKKESEFYNFKCRNLNLVDHFDSIRLGKTEILCLLTPGHTVGSVCYLISDNLYTGDTVFIEGCGICSTFGGDPEKMFNSIQMIKNTIKPHVRIFPGHSYGKTPGHQLSYLLKENIYFLINNKAYFIKFRMRKHQENLFKFY